MKKIIKILYVCVGFIAFSLGTLGVILPAIPTVPFYLVVLFCFSRGSERFHKWFLSTNLYKKHLENFLINNELSLSTKIKTCIISSAIMIFSIYKAPILGVKIFIYCSMIFMWFYFIFKIKTKK